MESEPRKETEHLLIFWLITVAMTLLVAALLVLAIVRGRQDAGAQQSGGYDVQVYREQLLEVERDQARGVIGEADAERVRVEISRRILAADAREQAETPGARKSEAAAPLMAAMAILLVMGSGVLYFVLGAPGYGDLGLQARIETARVTHENRPSQDQAEAQVPPAPPLDLDPNYKALIDQLREKVAGQPDDLQGQVLLAHHEAQSGNLGAARAAQAKVIAIKGEAATAEEYAQLGELLIVAANGYVSPQAEQYLRTALETDPSHGPARYYWGLMLVQTGRPDLAFRIWDRTLRQGPADAPWLTPILDGIGEMAWLAGVADYEVPVPRAPAAPLAGPSSEDIEAAAGMSAEDRQEMIQGMVARLSDRLASEGGSPDEWAQLIRAYGKLGNSDRAQVIYDEAKASFAENTEALSALRAAARQAGLEN